MNNKLLAVHKVCGVISKEQKLRNVSRKKAGRNVTSSGQLHVVADYSEVICQAC